MRTIADHILDITQNSIKAGAKNILLHLIEKNDKNMLKFIVIDDGKGMDEKTLNKVFDPFFTNRDHNIRKVGIGLPLLKNNCELTGGYVKIVSEPNKGTKIEAVFKTNSIDMPPVGDVAQSFLNIITSSDDIDFQIKREYNNRVYVINSKELKEFLGVNLSEPLIYEDLFDYLKGKEREITKNA